MTNADKRKMVTPHLSDEEAARRYRKLDEATFRFRGAADELEAAIGMYVIGRHVGWKVLYLLHSKATIRKYEEILGIKVREEFEAEGPDAERSHAYRIVREASNYWKAITESIQGKRFLE